MTTDQPNEASPTLEDAVDTPPDAGPDAPEPEGTPPTRCVLVDDDDVVTNVILAHLDQFVPPAGMRLVEVDDTTIVEPGNVYSPDTDIPFAPPAQTTQPAAPSVAELTQELQDLTARAQVVLAQIEELSGGSQ